MKEIGTVRELWIYPFKGMAGIKMEEINLKSISIVNDRFKAFTIIGGSSTPTLVDTIKFPDLLKYSPYLLQSENSKYPEIRVKTPEGKDYSADEPKLVEEISKKYGKPLALLSMGRGAYHSMPVSLISEASIHEIEHKVEMHLHPNRFRQNLIISTKSNLAYEEDSWIGKTLSFGDDIENAKIMVIKPDKRCATVNLNPINFENNPEILKTIVQCHDNTLGVYCAIVKEGKIKANSMIYLGA